MELFQGLPKLDKLKIMLQKNLYTNKSGWTWDNDFLLSNGTGQLCSTTKDYTLTLSYSPTCRGDGE